MKSKKILFIDTVHHSLKDILETYGMTCVDGSTWDELKTLAEINNYNGVVIRSRFKIGKTLLEKAINLEFIARAGAGMENIDSKLANEMGILCINAPEGNRNAVAEHALGMLLNLMNNLSKADYEVRKGIWNRENNRGTELEGKTIGLIGFGNTGKAFAKLLKGFDVKILVYDPYIKFEAVDFPGIKHTNLSEISEACDVVSFHVPLTEETHYMANMNFFSSFTKPIYIINTSRGKVLSIDDLIAAIEQNMIKGAALDVLEFEQVSFENISIDRMPDSFQKLCTLKNVLLSPHIAGWTFESHRKISEVLAKKIIDFYTS